MDSTKRELKREYTQTLRPMGIFQIKNKMNGKLLIGSSANIEAILRRHKVELRMGNHSNKALLADLKEHEEESFSFDVLESFVPEDPDVDYNKELKMLEELWLEKLITDDSISYMTKRKAGK